MMVPWLETIVSWHEMKNGFIVEASLTMKCVFRIIFRKLAPVKPEDKPTYLAINKWQPEDRPREKLLEKGARNLSSAELLAILIGSGTRNENALDITKRILDECGGSLRQLGRMDEKELMRHNGIGSAKAVKIMAACELSRRRSEETGQRDEPITSAQAAYNLMRGQLEDLLHEEFHVLLLNNNLQLQKKVLIAKGGLTATEVDVRLIMRSALEHHATAIIACHNHPSGSLTPSRADHSITSRIKKACELLQINLVDHVIISCEGFYSFAEHGQI